MGRRRRGEAVEEESDGSDGGRRRGGSGGGDEGEREAAERGWGDRQRVTERKEASLARGRGGRRAHPHPSSNAAAPASASKPATTSEHRAGVPIVCVGTAGQSEEDGGARWRRRPRALRHRSSAAGGGAGRGRQPPRASRHRSSSALMASPSSPRSSRLAAAPDAAATAKPTPTPAVTAGRRWPSWRRTRWRSQWLRRPPRQHRLSLSRRIGSTPARIESSDWIESPTPTLSSSPDAATTAKPTPTLTPTATTVTGKDGRRPAPSASSTSAHGSWPLCASSSPATPSSLDTQKRGDEKGEERGRKLERREEETNMWGPRGSHADSTAI